MTIVLEDMIKRFEAMRLSMTIEWPEMVAKAALDSVAIIEDRITQEGKGPNGSALKPYTKPYQKFKEAPQNTKRGQLLGLGSSRYTGKTDYSLTGAFWRDIQLRQAVTDKDITTVSVGPSTDVNKAIMKSLTKRDGFPLRLSETEQEAVSDQLKTSLLNIVDKYFPIQ